MLGLTFAFDLVASAGYPSDHLHAPTWVARDPTNVPASFVLDAANNRGWLNGKQYETEAALLEAAGGQRSGFVRTIGALVRGPELVGNGNFDSDVAGWTSNAVNVSLSWDSGRLILTNNTGALSAVAAYQSIPMDPKRAYQGGYKLVAGAFSSRLAFFGATTAAFRKSVIPPYTPVGTWTGTASAGPDCAIVMFRADSIANAGSVTVDEITVKEVVPFKGWNVGGYRQRVTARTPASLDTTQVVMELSDDLTLTAASGNSVQSRVRLEYRPDTSMHLIVTSASIEQADLNLGTVAPDADFTAEFRVGLTTVSAKLNGSAYTHSGLSYGAPGVARLHLASSGMGEAWTGAITSTAVWCLGITSVRFEGDSYIGGASGVGMPIAYCALSDRIVTSTGFGGSDMTGIRSRILDPNNRELLPAITVFWDGSPNGLTTVSGYCDQLQDCISALGHGRFVVIPPAIGDNTLKAQIRDEMARRWPSNTCDWRPYILNSAGVIDSSRFQSDGIHLNATGMAEAATGLKALLDAKGW